MLIMQILCTKEPSLCAPAGGNAYDEAIRDGYSPDQARAYAFLCGASEAGLQYFLGGISKLGSNVIGNSAIGKQVAASIQNIRSATMRVAAELGTKMLSEASEEYLQEILGPVFRNLALGEDNEFHLVTEEAAYAALLAIITTGVVEGPEVIGGEVGRSVQHRGAADIPAGMDENTWAALQRTAEEMYGADQAQKTAPVEGAAKTHMRLEDFVDVQSPVWNNIAYGDTEAQTRIMGDTHRKMVESGEVVTIPQETIEQVGEYYPDLRTIKKGERTPILKQKMGELKAALRNLLNGLKGSHEFEINGNILEVKLYDAGVSEVLEKITQSKAAVLTHSKEIFQKAQYLYSTPDYEGDPNIYRWNYFYTPVQIGNETVGVRIAVKDLKNPQESQLYHWGIKKDTAVDGDGRVENPRSPTDVSLAMSDPIIPSPGDGVNIEYAQPGGEDILTQTAPEMASEERLRQLIQQEAIRRTMLNVDEETEARLTQAAKEMYGADQTQKTAAQTDGGGRFSLKGYEGVDLSKDGSVYTYGFLTSLPDMSVTTLPDVTAVRDANGQVDTRTVVDLGMKNARAVGAERDGKVFVRNRYTGKQLLVTSESIRHGLNGNIKRLLTNARLGAVIGDVVQNAMPINALYNQAEGVTGTYAMAGYATDNAGREFVAIITVEQYDGNVSGIEVYDVAHAVSGRQKRGERVDTKSQGFYPSTNASTVSVSDFLKIVKETHQSILSEDVLSYFGEDRNPGGYYTDKAKFSLKTGEDALTQMALEMGAEGRRRGQESNAKAIQRAAHSFGEQGSQMLQELYWNDVQDPEEYFGGFAVYYHAGLTGQDIMSVREDYDDVIKPIQARAAYRAGQVDAAASLAAEIKAAGYAPVAGTDAGLVGDEYVASHLDSKTYRQLNSVLKLLGLRGRFVDGSLVLNGKANAQIKGSEVLIAKDHQHPIRFVLGHELTHRIQRLSPEAYRAFRDFVAQDPVVRNEIEYKRRTYGEKGVELDYEGALDEAVADYAGELLEDGRLMDEFIERHRENRSLLQWLKDSFHYLVGKLTGKEKAQAQTAEGKLAAALDAAAEQAKTLTKKSGGQNTAVQTDEAGRYLLNTDFAKEVDQWLEKTSPEDRLVSPGYFQVGTTSDALKSIGVRDGNIFWRKQKIGYIMTTHSEMDADTIKMVPDLIENPVVVMKSLTREDSIVLLGNVTGANGNRVMASLELTPRKGGGMEAEFALLTSAYSRTKGNIQNLLKNSEILYLDPDKKRTDTWLMQLGVQFPSRQPVYGSIGSISYDREKVNIQGVKNLFDTK